jgi:hypothetical protein
LSDINQNSLTLPLIERQRASAGGFMKGLGIQHSLPIPGQNRGGNHRQARLVGCKPGPADLLKGLSVGGIAAGVFSIKSRKLMDLGKYSAHGGGTGKGFSDFEAHRGAM